MFHHLSSFRILVLLVMSALACPALGATPYVDVGLDSTFSSNVYLNADKEKDWINAPFLNADLDFGETWTTGYDGRFEGYLFHPDLLFHEHELFLLGNPLFGPNKEHEATAEISLETQQNREEFTRLNLLEPTLFLEIAMEPTSWLRWSLQETFSFQWFYEDAPSTSLTSWTQAKITFTAKTRTTAAPRFSYGMRYFTATDDPVTSRQLDQQIEAGIHLSQGITDGIGLQGDYAYVHAFNDSVLVLRNLTDIAFDFIGDAFIYTGHRALLGFKALFGERFEIGVDGDFARKAYGGWPVLDDEGVPTDEERVDTELGPKVWFEYTYRPGQDASRAAPELSLSPHYAYRRIWSNESWYDTDRHLAGIELTLYW